MYVDQAIRFRDPFASEHSSLRHPHPPHHQSLPSWPPASLRPDLARALTPPPEMNGHSQHTNPSYPPQEHGNQYGDKMGGQQALRAPPAMPCLPLSGVSDVVRNGSTAAQADRGASPARPITAEPHKHAAPSHGSQTSSVAFSLQIPRSVNDSGGSLSELAAQITCLFWFESIELLNQIEDSRVPLHLSRPLVPDAKPTTGFRKWVATILSTTCVAQNVVLLALLFIHRLKMANPKVRGKPGSEYRLLTVALMLGNKFLDDNTYTNKTWADVSGINVAEVHIMEVEFLSNMKYHLYTSEQHWVQWQSLLGKYSLFIDRASRPLLNPPAPILPPASSLHLPMALPSPPVSNQASPPFSGDHLQNGSGYPNVVHRGLTPAPSPLGAVNETPVNHQPKSRKRSLDDITEPAAKRSASGYHEYKSPPRVSGMPAQSVPRLPLPSLSIPTPQVPLQIPYQVLPHSQQLPPLVAPTQRAPMAAMPSCVVSNPQIPQPALSLGPSPPFQPQSAMGLGSSRTVSPYGSSATVSPVNSLPPSATALQPTVQVSPSYFLQDRNSPYRPVRHFSTLLHPQPPQAVHNRAQNMELNQMHYQPLGTQQRQTGRLPYVAQNLWVDGAQPQEMTPVHQWPGFKQIPQQTVSKPHSHGVPR